jgi:hypothetical protein
MRNASAEGGSLVLYETNNGLLDIYIYIYIYINPAGGSFWHPDASVRIERIIILFSLVWVSGVSDGGMFSFVSLDGNTGIRSKDDGLVR